MTWMNSILMTYRRYRKIMGGVTVTLWFMAVTSAGMATVAIATGCASVSLSRSPETLTLEYSSFMKKLEAPAVQVTKEGDYSASFNAESSGVDPFAAQAFDMQARMLCALVPATCSQL